MKAVDMYEAYFNLQKRPFTSTPDPSCFFAPESIQEVFDELILRAESGQGVGILTAPAGTGKTLLCRRLASELATRWTPVFLANANFPTRRALLQSMLFELGKPYSRLEEQELRLSIYASLRELTQAGRGAVLIIDEAHLLSDRLLEELRMLASLAEGKLPLARVILAGQPLLEERMMQPALEALNQRVACQVYLETLSRRQSIDYVEYRIEWAGGVCSQIFNDAALESIAVGAGGLPRCLNQLCDHAMILAYAQEQPLVTREIVDEALLTLRQLPLRWNAPLAGQVSNLPVADDAGDIYQRQIDDEGCDLSSEGMESTASYGAGVEMTCIEIGGDAEPPVLNVKTSPMIETPKVAMLRARPRTGLLGAGVVPLPDASPQAMRGMVDELVVDRYARLDSSAPRLCRTFDDTAIPDSWQSTMHDDIPGAPEPPAKSAWSAADIVIEESVDEIEVHLDAEPRLVDSARAAEIDDLLGASVMDACREIQGAIDSGTVLSTHDAHWWNAPSSEIDIEEDVVIPEPDDKNDLEYDVVEPEHGVRQDASCAGRTERHAPSDSFSPATGVDGRYIPKPKYRNIFSTLRRRLGR